MRRTLLATAAALALGISGFAMANPCSDNSGSCSQQNKEGNNSLANTVSTEQSGTYNASEVSDEAKVFQNSFNKTAVVAATKLDGSVSNVGVSGIGNNAYNLAAASGGSGGDGAKGIGGRGGKAVAIGGDGGDGGKGGKGVGIGGDATAYSGDARAKGGNALAASVGIGGRASAANKVSSDDPTRSIARATGGSGTGAAATATGGDPSASTGYATASAGNGAGTGGGGGAGGAGGLATAEAGDGGNGTGGAGAAGGNGGTISVSAGTFDMSNTMSSVGQSAAGILMANQNSGAASLVQQGITVQANMTVGH
jgi:hypothetical protein